jgi:4-azaleucine resistance transporter AzlC
MPEANVSAIKRNKIKRRVILKATIDMLPFSLAVLPWGLLVGSLAIQRGFTPLEAQLTSTLVFSGAAQLVAIELISENASLLSLMLTTFIISSRHFLYGLSMRDRLKTLPTMQRLVAGYTLTDQSFVLNNHTKSFSSPLHITYGLAAAVSFGIAWNIWTFIGIVAGSYLPDLTNIGLDFAIAVTFIALVIPGIKTRSAVVAVVVAGVMSVVLELAQFNLALITAGLSGMAAGYWASFYDKEVKI